MRAILVVLVFSRVLCVSASSVASESDVDTAFRKLADRYVDELPAFSPVNATLLGDHRFDHQLDDVSAEARARRVRWIRDLSTQLDKINVGKLTRDNQVDYRLLKHALRRRLWYLEKFRDWEWNPLIYTGVTGDAIYGLVAREFAPVPERMESVTQRLRQFPRLLEQVRSTLRVERVPLVHAETAVRQNRGVISTLDHMVRPLMPKLSSEKRQELADAIDLAVSAIGEHQRWLEETMLPRAAGDYRIGVERFDEKLAFTLHSPLTRAEVRELAERRIRQLHEQMYEISKDLYQEQYPLTQFPARPSDAYRRAIIRFGLERAYAEAPKAGEIVATARRSVADATEFAKRKQLITVPSDPLEIIVMPEFQRGVSLAYCDSPGPLETGQKTFYAVSPIPKDWTPQQIRSHLREYNRRSIDVLTIHEAVPGHFLQLAHANRYVGNLRPLLQSGTFIEGWAVYTEWMMCEEGFRDHDPLLKLITLKWYLRDATNALLDQAVHVDRISREDAMQMMMEDAFQEEREAAGKWVRAQLTSAQLSTYFVGYLEHVALRREAEQEWGESFELKDYHDRVLSFGSPPVQFVRALLLGSDVP